MQMVFAIVGFQMVGPAAYTEHRVLDPVGVPPHKRAAAGAALGVEVVFVVGQGVMPYDHVHRALFCGDKDIFDHTAIVQHMHFQSAGVGDDVLVDLFAAFCHAKRLGTKLCHCARLLIIWFTPSRRTPECIFHNYDYIIVSHACGQNFLELTANILGDFLVVLQKENPHGALHEDFFLCRGIYACALACARNSAASSGMSSRSSSLPISTLSGGFLKRMSYISGTMYRVIRVA